MSNWNPRYLAYCYAHERSPEEMHAFDGQRFPGGRMCGFMCWNMQQWSEFGKTHKFDRHSKSKADHDAYDAWLEAKYLAAQRDMFAA
jgi:hypothetical protein